MERFYTRCWDIEMKSMVSWEEMQEQWECEGYDDCHFRGDHYIPMHCIGLKDKNRELIFEKDWLKDKDGYYCYVIYDDDSLRFAIESPESHAADYVNKEFFESSEVVGNICEHPELSDLQEQPDLDQSLV